MIDVLVLRFDAPLMSFGGARVDQLGPTLAHPGQAMLTGLLANALGVDRRETRRLDQLQARLRFAVRCDAPGSRIVDYQTVDLGQEHLRCSWTTHGRLEGREGGSAKTGTHQRWRHYVADAVYTVALTLCPAAEQPGLEQVATALREPARPLFIGRKPCLPSGPLLVGRLSAPSLLEALRRAPRCAHRPWDDRGLRAWWPAEEGVGSGPSFEFEVTDERDWANGIHVGRRRLRQGTLRLEAEEVEA